MQAAPVLVTGASGFVGRWAVADLSRRGVQVIAISRAPNSEVNTICCDLRDRDQVARVLAETRPRTILHLAWTTEHGQFWTARQNLDWVGASLNLARSAAEAGATRFIGIGTCFEYDWPSDSDCIENQTSLKPSTLYGVAKDATRRVLEEFGAFSFAWARLFHLFGPFEDRQRLVASVASRLALHQPTVMSRGTAVRDFLDVRDAGAALAALALSEVEGPVNIGSGLAVTVRQIAEIIGRIADAPSLIQPGGLPDRHEPPRIVADIRRLRDEVGFRPERDLERGLAECYAWWRERTAAETRSSNSFAD